MVVEPQSLSIALAWWLSNVLAWRFAHSRWSKWKVVAAAEERVSRHI